MAKSSAFVVVRGALQALALLVLVVAGWAAPQQAFAATDYLSAAPGPQGGSRQFRSRIPHALDWPRADPCALTRKLPSPRAEARRHNRAAYADSDAPADAHAILTAAGIACSGAGGDWQPFPTDRRIETTCPATFRSRAPPLNPLVTSIA